MNIVLCGFMGCGKSCVGKELARITKKEFIDTDSLIEKEQNTKISEIFDKYGEDYFRDLEHETCKKLAKVDNAIISTGGGVMTFERNVKAFDKNSKIVFLDTPFDVICKRVGDASTRPLFKNKENAKKLYDQRKSKYKNCANLIVYGDDDFRKIAKLISNFIK